MTSRQALPITCLVTAELLREDPAAAYRMPEFFAGCVEEGGLRPDGTIPTTVTRSDITWTDITTQWRRTGADDPAYRRADHERDMAYRAFRVDWAAPPVGPAGPVWTEATARQLTPTADDPRRR